MQGALRNTFRFSSADGESTFGSVSTHAENSKKFVQKLSLTVAEHEGKCLLEEGLEEKCPGFQVGNCARSLFTSALSSMICSTKRTTPILGDDLEDLDDDQTLTRDLVRDKILYFYHATTALRYHVVVVEMFLLCRPYVTGYSRH